MVGGDLFFIFFLFLRGVSLLLPLFTTFSRPVPSFLLFSGRLQAALLYQSSSTGGSRGRDRHGIPHGEGHGHVLVPDRVHGRHDRRDPC
jgi:hypothetical protein